MASEEALRTPNQRREKALTVDSSRSEAPIRAMDSDTMVPNTPVRIKILLTYFAKLVRVLSSAVWVAASALWA